MVIEMELKHVIQRGETYCFRMRVPKDCVKAIGKTEIIISLLEVRQKNFPIIEKSDKLINGGAFVALTGEQSGFDASCIVSNNTIMGLI